MKLLSASDTAAGQMRSMRQALGCGPGGASSASPPEVTVSSGPRAAGERDCYNQHIRMTYIARSQQQR